MIRRIAHLSDVHMLDPRTEGRGAGYRLATHLVSYARRLDPAARSRNLTRALELAKAGGAQHVVISGDLTEVGSRPEFDRFAEVLSGAGFAPDAVTLVPGNHDAYTEVDGWARAMRGPLRAYASASADAPGKIVDRGSVVFVPVDSTRYQSIARSGGEIREDATRAIERAVAHAHARAKAVVVVQHHPPVPHRTGPVWTFVDGLRGWARLVDLLRTHPSIQLLHGHLHKVVDRFVGEGKGSRIFGAPATVDDRDLPRVRLYDVVDGGLVALAPRRA